MNPNPNPAIAPHGPLPPSPWVRRHLALVPERPGGARVLDLACGHGRHLRWLASLGRGLRLTGIDRDADAIASLRDLPVEGLVADLEGPAWPLAGRDFDAVIVTNYLWRPRMADTAACVAPGGVLLWETFAQGQASVGRPARADFLLRPGELIDLARAAGLRVIAYEDGFLDAPARFVQRVAAVREMPAGASSPPARHPLEHAG